MYFTMFRNPFKNSGTTFRCVPTTKHVVLVPFSIFTQNSTQVSYHVFFSSLWLTTRTHGTENITERQWARQLCIKKKKKKCNKNKFSCNYG